MSLKSTCFDAGQRFRKKSTTWWTVLMTTGMIHARSAILVIPASIGRTVLSKSAGYSDGTVGPACQPGTVPVRSGVIASL